MQNALELGSQSSKAYWVHMKENRTNSEDLVGFAYEIAKNNFEDVLDSFL